MATITPTAPTFTQVFAPVVVTAASAGTGGLGTRYTLDLTTKRGAWLYGRIGRRVATALTRSGFIAVRPTANGGLTLPTTRYDIVSSIAVAISTTLNGAVSVAATNFILTSAASFAVGDVLCLHSDDSSANRVEFCRINQISSNTVYTEFPIGVAHDNLDRVTTMGDVIVSAYLPGGDIYEIRAQNNSGQDMLFALDAVVDNGDTST